MQSKGMLMADLLAGARVNADVWDRFPDYVAVVMSVMNLRPGPCTDHSEKLLAAAEAEARTLIGEGAAHDLPDVAVWREAYASFGVKPRDARSSIESLLRRVDKGLPRIDRLTDVYNAISVMHRIPIGGENLAAYVGPPQLVISDGTDLFDTTADGKRIEEGIPAGEIVWKDDAGVTCRRWNWRQCVRTRLGEETEQALFIIDGLGPEAKARAESAADALVRELRVDSPDLQVEMIVLESVPRQ
jgi:DNA/RNA-binding domain of Phe-tRNA-synthetase-like protein